MAIDTTKLANYNRTTLLYNGLMSTIIRFTMTLSIIGSTSSVVTHIVGVVCEFTRVLLLIECSGFHSG